MKTLILNGSPRPNGDTASLVKILAEKLEGECRIIDCYRADISPCVDCRACRKKSGCAIKDDMQDIYRYAEECDNVILASPIYFSELTGKLLDVASRFQTYFSAKFFRGEKPEIRPKRGAVILVGGGNGKPDNAYSTAVCILKLINVQEIYPLVCSHNTDNVPAIQDIGAVEKIKALAEFLNGADLQRRP